MHDTIIFNSKFGYQWGNKIKGAGFILLALGMWGVCGGEALEKSNEKAYSATNDNAAMSINNISKRFEEGV